MQTIRTHFKSNFQETITKTPNLNQKTAKITIKFTKKPKSTLHTYLQIWLHKINKFWNNSCIMESNIVVIFISEFIIKFFIFYDLSIIELNSNKIEEYNNMEQIFTTYLLSKR